MLIVQDIAKNSIFRIGEHSVFAMLKVIGKYIGSSGLDQVSVESDMFGPVTKGQIIDGKQLKRVDEAHTMLYLTMHPAYFDKAVSTDNNPVEPLQQIERLEGFGNQIDKEALSTITTYMGLSKHSKKSISYSLCRSVEASSH